LVQNVEIHKLYVKGQIENPFHVENYIFWHFVINVNWPL
jgi:hypothetical protein